MKMSTAHLSTQSTLHSIVYVLLSFILYSHLQLFKMNSKCLHSLLALGAENKQSLAVTSARKKCYLPVHVLPSTLSTDPSGQKQTGPLDV